MANPSPLHDHYQQLEAVFMPYGEGVRIVGEVESHEVEYAAIRKAVGLLDCPHRGLLRLTGGDHLDFLHRMLTNDCLALRPGDVQRNFLLNVKGRILADLILSHGETHTLLDTGVHEARTVAEELDNLLFGEDVRIENLSDDYHRLSLHGPNAPDVLEWWRNLDKPDTTTWEYRYDETGEPGVHIWMPADAMTRFTERDRAQLEHFGLRPIGWLAFNIARIEAGRPMFNIDFGPDSLPHETGILHEAVCFTAGCYRGQEIVARMESRGHPAKTLVGFRADAPGAEDGKEDVLPLAGTPVLDSVGPDAGTVGAVTSSAFSPMLGHAPIGFAVVKWAHHAVGTELVAPAEGVNVPITVHELQFLPHRSDGSK